VKANLFPLGKAQRRTKVLFHLLRTAHKAALIAFIGILQTYELPLIHIL